MYANLNKQTPGPGKYELGSTLSTMQYSMRPRTQGDIMILNKFVPGLKYIYIYIYYQALELTKINHPSIQQGSTTSLSSVILVPLYLILLAQNGSLKIKVFFEINIIQDPLQVPGPGTHTVENTGIQKVIKLFYYNRMENIP